MLDKGGSSLDAIEAVITVMEDDPLFNAGKGAVFTAAGTVELDAAIMDGKTLNAGAVAGLTTTRHPITARPPGDGEVPPRHADRPGRRRLRQGPGPRAGPPTAYFYTAAPLAGPGEGAEDATTSPSPPKPAVLTGTSAANERLPDDHRYGTVGVVALDSAGNIAAGTSTGGTTAKRWGRVGDTPVIGAGNYANNESCAVSGTGKGEYFIRLTVAREICALVQYKGMTLQAAADEVIQKRMPALGKDGGVIAIAPDGQMAWSFNTSRHVPRQSRRRPTPRRRPSSTTSRKAAPL